MKFLDCSESGYMCMAFYKRDGHVVELQTGSTVSRMEEACSAPHYSQRTVPYVTLVSEYPLRFLFFALYLSA